MTYKERAEEINIMQAQGQCLEAFEKCYAEDCQICEKPTGEIRNEKEAQRKVIQEWFSIVKEHHGGSVGPITSDEGAKITMVQPSTDVTMHQGGRMKIEQAAVQQ